MSRAAAGLPPVRFSIDARCRHAILHGFRSFAAGFRFSAAFHFAAFDPAPRQPSPPLCRLYSSFEEADYRRFDCRHRYEQEHFSPPTPPPAAMKPPANFSAGMRVPVAAVAGLFLRCRMLRSALRTTLTSRAMPHTFTFFCPMRHFAIVADRAAYAICAIF